MLRLFGFIVAAMLVLGFFAPDLQRLANLDPAAAPKPDQPVRPSRPAPMERVEIAADARGHFPLSARVNGRPMTLLADTGATTVALRASDARAAGLLVLPGDYTQRVTTANGEVAAATARLQEIEVGDIRLTGVEALVLPDKALGMSLLGMSFLGRLKSFSVEDGRLLLVR